MHSVPSWGLLGNWNFLELQLISCHPGYVHCTCILYIIAELYYHTKTPPPSPNHFLIIGFDYCPILTKFEIKASWLSFTGIRTMVNPSIYLQFTGVRTMVNHPSVYSLLGSEPWLTHPSVYSLLGSELWLTILLSTVYRVRTVVNHPSVYSLLG